MTNDKYQYEGQLLFNGIYNVQTSDPSPSRQDIINGLPQYEQGSGRNPQEGFATVDLEPYLSNNQEDKFTSTAAEDIVHFRHYHEQYYDADTDRIEDSVVRRVHKVDIFWSRYDGLFIRGSRGAVNHTVSRFQNELEKLGIDLEKQEFSSDFLLWILYRHFKGAKLDARMTAQRITGAKVENTIEDITTGSEFMGSEELLNSPTFTAELCRGSKIMELTAEYEMFGYQLTAKVSSDGRIHVKGASGDIGEYSSFRRMLISLRFIQSIVDIFRTWKQSSAEKKYPPTGFFEELFADAEENGITINSSPEDVFLEYNQKRAGRTMDNDDNIEDFDDSLPFGQALQQIVNRGIETETVEFKESVPDQVADIAKDLVALANHRGGILVIGVTNDGEIVGLEEPQKTEERVSGILTDTVKPPLNTRIEFARVQSHDLLVVRVKPYEYYPHSANYKFYKRLGTIRRHLTPHELFQ